MLPSCFDKKLKINRIIETLACAGYTGNRPIFRLHIHFFLVTIYKNTVSAQTYVTNSLTFLASLHNAISNLSWMSVYSAF